MKKIPAFTLIELLVAMALSGLVSAAAFSAYRVTAGNYARYQRSNTGVRDASWLQAQLGKDIERADFLSGNSENLQLNFREGRVRYFFSEEFVLRRDSFVTDTFHLPISDVKFFLSGKPVGHEEALADEIRIEATVNGEKERLHFLKTYPAESWLSRARGEGEGHGGN